VESTDTTTAAVETRAGLRRSLGALLLGGTLLVALHDWLGLAAGLDFEINGLVYDAVVLGAAAACFLRASAFERERVAWLLIGLSIASWGVAEVYWTAFIEGNPGAPYPSPADIGYLAFYPLAGAGLVVLVRARAHELEWRLWTDGLIAALGTAALGTAFVFDFVADRTTGTTLQVATTLAYPLGDIAMLAMVVGVVGLTGWRPGPTWSLLLAGLAALVAADVIFTLQSNGAGLPGGDWAEPIYLIAAACLGAEAWQPRAETILPAARFDDWRELIVPGFFATVMIGLFTMQYFSATSGLATVLWAATMIAVLLRLALSVRENRALLEQVQTDPLTGLGNRGRMQVDLERLCARVGEAQPAALLFLDLNGFKRYNDTFGHPEGDELLARLGGALRDAVGEDGTAYRIGGDEFCLLLTCREESFDLATREAVKALTASGKGFEVSASWGMATIPGEATTPSEALQLADVRMYAQKESRSLARDFPAVGDAGAEVLRAPGP
jgi:two-component system cell cycle response regulator